MSNGSLESHAGELLMRVARIVGLPLLLLTAACGGVKPALTVEPPTSARQAVVEAPVPAVAPATTPSPPPPTNATPDVAAAVEPAERPAAPSTTASTARSAAKAGPPAAKSPAKAPAPPAPAAQPPKKEPVASEAAKPKAEPPLDLASLETRLKDTKAIGVMTKLALKNQVDDLLNQFRAFYQGKLKTTLPELRRAFDLLILKVLSLLQDSDPPLATAIAASREAIWGILSDPVKFANFASI